VRENANRQSDARKRITEGLACLKKLKRSFTTVELQEAAACSRETLYKHVYVLVNYLSLAPCEEDERSLVPYVRQLRKELQVRVTSAQIFEQPPEIGFS